ncbi:MAG: hypothetical protein DMG57_08555 [Acidobacteria bacterium]|nr:MAG: hypothetical protein DMG57_08555 [Acidobacteriota bacterium]
MRRFITVLAGLLIVLQLATARQTKVICGTNPERWKVELFLHRQAERARRAAQLQSTGSPTSRPSAARDIGNIAVLEDGDGIVARRNPFDLDQKTLTFSPVAPLAASYKFQVAGDPYDSAAASSGVAVPMGDDDFRKEQLPFTFPLFGKTYQAVFINSDGDLTFNEGENASTDRSLGRMVAGPPRIAPLFEDLDPSKTPQGITVSSDLTRFVVSWVKVPPYSNFGFGTPQTFQVRLYPDGRIQFAYAGIATTGAVVGISPGRLQGSSSVVSFSAGSSAQYSSTMAERFGGDNEIDIETATQKFLETHDDAYDYIAFFNNEDIPSGPDSVSWEETIRNFRTGYGDIVFDVSSEFGSHSRLQSVLNMGPLSQFPVNPGDILSVRAESGYNSLKLITHEAGHLFLAYASVLDPNNPTAQPMLGIQQAHWAFNFNAEASVMEGNRIKDDGAGASPRFVVTDTVEHYSPLDQYLMGFRPASEVPPSFLVTGHAPSFSLTFPQVGVTFNGGRRDIGIEEIEQAMGRRTPDYTVSQRHFRMAFVLIVNQGTTPSAPELTQLENLRSQFEGFFQQATDNRASIDIKLRHALSLSVAPAAGVLAGGAGNASVSIQQPATEALPISLSARGGNTSIPTSVTIPKGAASASFIITGKQQGVDELAAIPPDDRYETAYAHVQVLGPSALSLVVVSGDKQVIATGGTLTQPVVLRVTDSNHLSYQGATVQAWASVGGSVSPQSATSDANGFVTFRWAPGAGPMHLQVTLSGSQTGAGLTIMALPPTSISPSGIVNAASFVAGLSPGALSTVYGTTLAGGITAQSMLPWPDSINGVRVLVNGQPSQLLYVSDSQINFLVSPDLAPGTASVTVETSAGTSASSQVAVSPVSPGIFFDVASGFGAILNAGTSQTTRQRPVSRGQYIEIYCTGLGAVSRKNSGTVLTVSQPQVLIGSIPLSVSFSGLAPIYNGGLYQVNAQISSSVPSGIQSLIVIMNGVQSNTVKVAIQ